MASFGEAGKAWEEKVELKKAEVFHASLRDLTEEVEQNTPKVTGNTANSLSVSTLGPVTIDWKTKKFRDPSDAINNAIAGAETNATVWIGFRAPWAHKLEPKYAMMRLAAQRWVEIVNAAAGRLRR
jgi:hypothetical protein